MTQTGADAPRHDLTIAAIFKNENLYIQEWLEFHFGIAVPAGAVEVVHALGEHTSPHGFVAGPSVHDPADHVVGSAEAAILHRGRLAAPDHVLGVGSGRVLAIGTTTELRETAHVDESATFAEVFGKLASRDTEVPVGDFLAQLGAGK